MLENIPLNRRLQLTAAIGILFKTMADDGFYPVLNDIKFDDKGLIIPITKGQKVVFVTAGFLEIEGKFDHEIQHVLNVRYSNAQKTHDTNSSPSQAA